MTIKPSISRRRFHKLCASTVLFSAAPSVFAKQRKPRVIVIGGGAGGATIAKQLAALSANTEVVLIEPNKRYYSCFFSNLYLGGFRALESLGHGYQNLVTRHGINVIHDWVVTIDAEQHQVRLSSGKALDYQKLVVAPGIDIDYESLPGYSLQNSDLMPHAWKSGTQLAILKQQIAQMPKGGTYLMVAPPNPYRCPPGPYERICMVAHYLKQHNPRGKIIILDNKDSFSKQALFTQAWSRHYKNMIEWLPLSVHGGINNIDQKKGIIETELDKFKVDVANVVPSQFAGHIARQSGLANDSGWCEINPATLQSLVDPDIFVLGDACIAKAMPKSAFSANSQAKFAAHVITAQLHDLPLPEASYANICWSLLSDNDSVKIGANYRAGKQQIEAVNNFLSKTDESPQTRQQTYQESVNWYQSISDDMFK